MTKKEKRTFQIDGDRLEVEFRYDADWKVWLGDFPLLQRRAAPHPLRTAMAQCHPRGLPPCIHPRRTLRWMQLSEEASPR